MHITIAGRLGSGKSTVCSLLKERYGYEIYSTGAIQRKIAADMGITTLQLNELMNKDSKYDHLLDDTVASMSRECRDRTIIFDSRMAWHFACDSFKIYLIIDPYIAAERVFANRHTDVESYASVEDAKEALCTRATIENERFKDIYKTDNFDYRNYDCIIDSSYATPDEVCDKIYEQYLAFCNGEFTASPRIFISPKILYPTRLPDASEPSDTPITLTAQNGYHYIATGHAHVLRALQDNTVYVSAALSKSGVADAFRRQTADAFSSLSGFTYRSYPQ